MKDIDGNEVENDQRVRCTWVIEGSLVEGPDPRVLRDDEGDLYRLEWPYSGRTKIEHLGDRMVRRTIVLEGVMESVEAGVLRTDDGGLYSPWIYGGTKTTEILA